ncbi:2-C-methyl-D-erythritol 2,4-cyclodiphosphate synthase, partial [Isoptericola sp. QY 916]|nr:2-C-methyl-D-erythritol 2,4-cyclodiphosphate synthase [Isoptericola sp. QY 916]
MTGPSRGLPRTGLGVDVHAYAPEGSDRELWLGGLRWPGERPLAGHSDADVARAIVNATGTWSKPFWPAYPGQET